MTDAELVTVEGKRMQRKGHSCKNSIETQSFGRRETIHPETLGNQYNFDGGQYREQKPVQSQGNVPYARSQIVFAQVVLYDVKIQNCSETVYR